MSIDQKGRELARNRFFEIMRRHIEADDWQLPDADLVDRVIKRYEKARGLALIDPNE